MELYGIIYIYNPLITGIIYIYNPLITGIIYIYNPLITGAPPCNESGINRPTKSSEEIHPISSNFTRDFDVMSALKVISRCICYHIRGLAALFAFTSYWCFEEEVFPPQVREDMPKEHRGNTWGYHPQPIGGESPGKFQPGIEDVL